MFSFIKKNGSDFANRKNKTGFKKVVQAELYTLTQVLGLGSIRSWILYGLGSKLIRGIEIV